MNGTLIEELLEEMERNVGRLREMQKVSREDFAGDPHHYLYAERCFQLAIQCLVDTCCYLAAQKRWQKPESASEAVELLARQGVLTETFGRRIAGMANFRNILVHAYLKIDREVVYSMLDRLDDFGEFARQVLDYLEG